MSSPSWGSRQLEPGHTNPAAFHQLASSITQSASSSRAQKRRLDPEDDSELSKSSAHRDESMDRSPTPERAKRAAPKRARVANAQYTMSKDDAKGRKHSEEDHIDIGVLLGKMIALSSPQITNYLFFSTPTPAISFAHSYRVTQDAAELEACYFATDSQTFIRRGFRCPETSC